MNNWKIGVSCNFSKGTPEKIFDECKKAGIGAIEISPAYNMRGIEYAKDVYSKLDLKKIKSLSDETGVELWSYHLPFCHSEINPACFDKGIRRQTIEFDGTLMENAAEMGIKVAVLHASGEPIDDKERAESMKYAIESICEINEKAKQYGIILAVENLPRTCLGRDSEEILKLIEADESIKLCFDVNHLLTQSHKDFVKGAGHKIASLHISDYDFIDERHLAPGRGKIDWKELVELLEGVGYNGPFMNEVAGVVLSENKEDGIVTFDELKKINDAVLGRA